MSLPKINLGKDNIPENDVKKRCVDPYTGRKIHLALQNGFSSFNANLKIEEEKCFTIIRSRFDSQFSAPADREIGIECAVKHYNDLTFRRGWKNQSSMANNPLRFSSQVFVKEDSHMKEFVKSWTNPVLGVAKDTCLEAHVTGSFPRQRKISNLLTSFPLSKNSLKGFEVIGQVDNKFIACKCIVENGSKINKQNSFLLLIDQHAAHERVRLENLQKEFLCTSKNSQIPSNLILSKTLKPFVSISLSLPFEKSMRNHKNEFLKIGVSYTIQNEVKMDDKNYVTLLLQSLPNLFVKEYKHGSESKPILEVPSIKELFYEHIKWLDSVSSMSSSVIPPAINAVLCSYSCHGAIRFGDALSLTECKTLIDMLANCKLPFQCAHGRPSISPLVNLSSLAADARKEQKPKLWRLKRG